MKKLSTVIIILILEIVFHNINYANSQPDPKIDELNKVSDYKSNKGTMGNVMNLYMSPPVEGRGVINSRQFLSHDLIFPIEYKSYMVTIQELDYKARHWLTKEKKLYEFDGSAFESGYIKFTEKNNTSFWFDLFPKKELVPFVPYKFLNIYGDNKVVDSKSIKMEVFLNTH